MPDAAALPSPPFRLLRLLPLEEQDTSYLADSARMLSFLSMLSFISAGPWILVTLVGIYYKAWVIVDIYGRVKGVQQNSFLVKANNISLFTYRMISSGFLLPS